MKKYKLKKVFAKRWVDALRSGDYKQGKHYLESDGNYCCLGVACRIQVPSANLSLKSWIRYEHDGVSYTVLNKMPKLLIGDEENEFVSMLARMNDRDVSFNEIANWIEENVEFI